MTTPEGQLADLSVGRLIVRFTESDRVVAVQHWSLDA
jgi:hypothetical protein